MDFGDIVEVFNSESEDAKQALWALEDLIGFLNSLSKNELDLVDEVHCHQKHIDIMMS